ncbi:E3 SUMO-protein ligase PIAS1 [Melanomma pulvis-pyrius CBS 109.77]|uniref:E3 SUMO-protein ligase PIAS1 n=1 Tax=Melanomma pulvis-pyrius CBS 109.77 TaxID=1314802 RepID=A0A6A6WVB9_9PLEO|nr:E3 SUMO-protein ligase PIAS1 [Melanomma pulvis-pyrius CBS 109.77]
MASSTPVHALAATLNARLKTLINNVLKRICKEEGLPQTGNKPVLQARILNLINDAVQANDAETLMRLRHRIQNHGEAPPVGSDSPSTPTYPTHAGPPAQAYNGFHQPFGPMVQQMALRPLHLFKESAFYEMRQVLVDGVVLEASPNHRQNCQKSIQLKAETCDRLKADPTLRILLFSAVDQPLAGFTREDITFPSQIEVRVNGEEVKANYKGLKNKPGSTRPVDITDFIRKSPAEYKNTLLITYALTHKKFNLQVTMVKKNSIEDLTRRISRKNVITKHSVQNEMLKKANDPDIVVGSSIMSLKDPISTLRISIPVRSTICTHNQCFDAESFLQLQEQAPTWQCPICNKAISFEGLAVDEYFKEILDSVPRGTDQVTVEPNGQWSNDNAKPTSRNSGYGYDKSPESDEELVEIPDYRVSAIKNEAYTPQSFAHTPPLSSREASTAPRTGSKRGSEVIDLTLSDDDEPARPAKKVAYSTPSSLPDPPRRYQPHAFGTPSIPSRPPPPPLNGMPSGLRIDTPSSQTLPSFGPYRQPPPRSSYPGQGTSTYPTYLGSSP